MSTGEEKEEEHATAIPHKTKILNHEDALHAMIHRSPEGLCKEHTEIRPAFGKTLRQAIAEVNLMDREELNRRTGLFEGRFLVGANPFANKLLYEFPEFLTEASLIENPSEEALYLYLQQGFGFFGLVNKFVHLDKDTFRNIDTYLPLLPPTKFSFICDSSGLFNSIAHLPNVFPFVMKHWEQFKRSSSIPKTLNQNPAAIDWLIQHPEFVCVDYLAANTHPQALAILRDRVSELTAAGWMVLCHNPTDEAVALLQENPKRIFFPALAVNPNPNAINLCTQLWSQKQVGYLSNNPSPLAVKIMAEHLEQVDWRNLCMFARTRDRFALIRQNLDKVDWDALCQNKSELASALLEEHPHRIHWHYSLLYQNIFETTTEYDYQQIRNIRQLLHSEFHAWAGHPQRVLQKHADWGFDSCTDA